MNNRQNLKNELKVLKLTKRQKEIGTLIDTYMNNIDILMKEYDSNEATLKLYNRSSQPNELKSNTFNYSNTFNAPNIFNSPTNTTSNMSGLPELSDNTDIWNRMAQARRIEEKNNHVIQIDPSSDDEYDLDRIRINNS